MSSEGAQRRLDEASGADQGRTRKLPGHVGALFIGGSGDGRVSDRMV